MLDKSALASITAQVVIAVQEAGSFIKNELGKVSDQQIEVKAKNSLVSYVDQQAEKMLVDQLSKIIPESGFITEEDTKDSADKSFVWIIDPLDGTTNFLYNIPHFSTSVALAFEGELQIGVVSDIMRDDIFWAHKDGGAWLNDRKIVANPETDFSQCILATGFPYATSYEKQPYFEMMRIIMENARGMRRFGSAALDMAYVACGRFNAFYETSLNPWDVAGGIVICNEAGAVTDDYFGTETHASGRSIIAANPEILKVIKSHTSRLFNEDQLANQ